MTGPPRDDGDTDAAAQRAHAAIAVGDWPAVRALLHPYLRWTDGTGQAVRGRSPAGRKKDKYAARISQMGQTPQWYDDAYGVALRITPQGAWTIPR